MVEDDDAAGSGAFDSVVGRVEVRLARGRPSGPVEAPDEPVVIAPAVRTDPRGFRTGVLLGMTWFAILVHGWLAIGIGRLATYSGDIPSGSKLTTAVTGAAWRWGSLVGLVALAAGSYALVGRGKRWPLVITAVVTGVVVAIMGYAISYRINELTGPAS